MRIIFFGTGKFAIPSLKCLLNSDHEILAVVSRPDRKKGRGYNVMPPPVKAYAEKDIFQPESAEDPGFIRALKELEADLFTVIDYGQKINDELLEVPLKYCINLHPSLLPEYRGASPVNRAILDGKTITGNSVFKMEKEMDAGDIILREQVRILPEETAVELSERMALKGADLLLKTVNLISEGKETLKAQDKKAVTYAPKIRKEDGLIDWNNRAVNILNQVRALQPWPGAYTYLNGRLLKIFKAKNAGNKIGVFNPGTIIRDKGFSVATGDGIIDIIKVQLEGKKIMYSDDFLKGIKVVTGNILGI
jgi:methionyl-tRNA formyltransferase